MKRSTKAETERVYSWMPFWFGTKFIRRQAAKRLRAEWKRRERDGNPQEARRMAPDIFTGETD